jgi:hypothetical protein
MPASLFSILFPAPHALIAQRDGDYVLHILLQASAKWRWPPCTSGVNSWCT